jgi:hemerythrin-like metal-binding protein
MCQKERESVSTDDSGLVSDLSLGIESIDADHRRMVRSVEAIENAVKRGADPAMLAELMGGLLERTREHFAIEERLMQEAGHPEREDHVREHERLVRQLDHLRGLYASGKPRSAAGLMGELRPWLLEHIEGPDYRLAQHLSATAVRAAPKPKPKSKRASKRSSDRSAPPRH